MLIPRLPPLRICPLLLPNALHIRHLHLNLSLVNPVLPKQMTILPPLLVDVEGTHLLHPSRLNYPPRMEPFNAAESQRAVVNVRTWSRIPQPLGYLIQKRANRTNQKQEIESRSGQTAPAFCLLKFAQKRGHLQHTFVIARWRVDPSSHAAQTTQIIQAPLRSSQWAS